MRRICIIQRIYVNHDIRTDLYILLFFLLFIAAGLFLRVLFFIIQTAAPCHPLQGRTFLKIFICPDFPESIFPFRLEVSGEPESILHSRLKISGKPESLLHSRLEISGKPESILHSCLKISGKPESLLHSRLEISGNPENVLHFCLKISGKLESVFTLSLGRFKKTRKYLYGYI